MTHSFPTRRSSDLSESRLPVVQLMLLRLIETVHCLEQCRVDQRSSHDAAQLTRCGFAPLHQDTHPLLRESTQRRRSEEHTSELQSLMRISYAVFCLKKKTTSVTIITVA